MEYTLYTKAEIAAMIEDGIPENTTIYYFNPNNKLGEKVSMIPLSTATIGNIMNTDAGFIGIKETDTNTGD